MSLLDDRIIPKLQGQWRRKPGGGLTCRCPAHDDSHASLSIDVGDDGRLLLRCFAGCKAEDILAAFGLEWNDVFLPREMPAVNPRRPRKPRKSFMPTTVDQLADAKCLPAVFLRQLGVTEHISGGVLIPYGAGARSRIRRSLSASDGSYWGKTPDALPIRPYGVDRLADARKAGFLIIVEGESDCWTCWHHGLPALGVPGATLYGKLEGGHVNGIDRLYAVQEPGAAGEGFVKGIRERLRAVGWSGDARAVRMPDGIKDPNDLHRQQPDSVAFRAALMDACKNGVPLADAAPKTVDFLDDFPSAIARPLCVVGAHAYATTWLCLSATEEAEPVSAILRDDGAIFCDTPIDGAKPLRDLGVIVRRCQKPTDDYKLLWGGGVRRFQRGERPDPADVFGRLVRFVDHFVDFDLSLAPQQTMCELIACYILSTYMLDAFDVAGYVHAGGERGNGKTQLVMVIAEVGYLGKMMLDGSSFATIRNSADLGGFIGFDDAEKVMDPKTADPAKRELLLAGNRRGNTVELMEPMSGKGRNSKGWAPRVINTFCPRGFSAINTPDGVLGSRAITIPLARSERRAIPSPAARERWPLDGRRLIDDLWLTGLCGMRVLRQVDQQLDGRVSLTGRLLEPWRMVLSTAMYLEEQHGAGGLFKRLKDVAEGAYQQFRGEQDISERTAMVLRGIAAVLACGHYQSERVQLASGSEIERFIFKTSDVVDEITRFAKDADLLEPGKDTYLTGRVVGNTIRKMRFCHRPSTGEPGNRRWSCALGDLDSFSRRYGVRIDDATRRTLFDVVVEDGEVLKVS